MPALSHSNCHLNGCFEYGFCLCNWTYQIYSVESVNLHLMVLVVLFFNGSHKLLYSELLYGKFVACLHACVGVFRVWIKKIPD